jgi:hypothetical protein
MITNGKASFTTKSWDEKPYTEIDSERKLTCTHAVFTYTGDIEGEGTVDYLMAYSPKGMGNFVGMEHFVGRVGGRAGTFVVQHTGTFNPKSVNTYWSFVPGSGTDELAGLSGGGELVLEGHGPYPITFDYDLR